MNEKITFHESGVSSYMHMLFWKPLWEFAYKKSIIAWARGVAQIGLLVFHKKDDLVSIMNEKMNC